MTTHPTPTAAQYRSVPANGIDIRYVEAGQGGPLVLLHSGIVSTNPVDKAAQFGHMAGFGSLQPGVQCLHLACFEPGDKLLAQEVDGAKLLVEVHLLHLLLLHLAEFQGW